MKYSEKYLKVMADHSAPTLWGEDGVGLDTTDFPAISKELQADLEAWGNDYDVKLYPHWSSQPNAKEIEEFNNRGEALVARLRKELPDYKIDFYKEP
jgi:hypothetical protein